MGLAQILMETILVAPKKNKLGFAFNYFLFILFKTTNLVLFKLFINSDLISAILYTKSQTKQTTNHAGLCD